MVMEVARRNNIKNKILLEWCKNMKMYNTYICKTRVIYIYIYFVIFNTL